MKTPSRLRALLSGTAAAALLAGLAGCAAEGAADGGGTPVWKAR